MSSPLIFAPLRTVRAKLIFWSVTVLALALFLFGGLLRYTVQRDILLSVDRDIESFSHRVAEDWNREQSGEGAGWAGWDGPGREDRFPGPPPGPPRGPGPEERRGNEENTDGAPLGTPVQPAPRVLSLSGQVLSRPHRRREPEWTARVGELGSGPWDKAAFDAALNSNWTGFSTVQADAETLRVYTIPLRNEAGQAKAILQISRPLSEVNWALGRVTHTLLLFTPFCLMIAGVGGAFLTTRILRPVCKLAEAADTITGRELSGRLPVSGDDEFARLSETFNRMLTRLETSFEQQRRFTSDASHELRTPLAAIKAHTGLALQGDRSADELRQALVTVDGATDRAARTVQDLLLLARSDTGRLGVQLAPTYLPDVILRAIETVEAATVDKEWGVAPIELRLEGPEPTVNGDAHHLQRLFTNLIENAIRHTPPTGQVTVLMQTGIQNVMVSVVDTGEGIAPEHLAHLGERFYRVDTSRARASGGTGLGLAISRSIVDAHGGQLSIESTPGQGTAARVTLPCAGV